MASASIRPSNMGMSKFTCTLKGVAPPEWLLRCAASGKSLKDMGEVIHHRVPLFFKGLLEQHFDRIFYALVFLFAPHGWPSRFARLILQRFN